MAKQSKLTVQYYLNYRLKPELIDDKKKYPMYVRFTYERQNIRFKSIICNDYYTENDMNNTNLIDLQSYETRIIVFIIKKFKESSTDYDLVSLIDFLAKDVKYFTDMHYINSEIKDYLESYVKIKTGLSIEMVKSLFYFYMFSEKDFKDFDINIFDNTLKDRIEIVKHFIDFKSKRDNLIRIFDWKVLEINKAFIDYLEVLKLNFDFKNIIDEVENRINISASFEKLIF